jgi:hypothetical protein
LLILRQVHTERIIAIYQYKSLAHFSFSLHSLRLPWLL